MSWIQFMSSVKTGTKAYFYHRSWWLCVLVLSHSVLVCRGCWMRAWCYLTSAPCSAWYSRSSSLTSPKLPVLITAVVRHPQRGENNRRLWRTQPETRALHPVSHSQTTPTSRGNNKSNPQTSSTPITYFLQQAKLEIGPDCDLNSVNIPKFDFWLYYFLSFIKVT